MIDQSHDFLGTLFGLIADVAIAIIIAEFTDIPFITIVLFMLFIRIFFAIRDTIWEWIAYFAGLRRAQQKTLVNLMRNKKSVTFLAITSTIEYSEFAAQSRELKD